MSRTHYPEQKDSKKMAIEALADFGKQDVKSLENKRDRVLKKKRKKKRYVALQLVIVIVCLGVTANQLYKMPHDLGSRKKPIRQGAMVTDALTDQCISNLWKASKCLQEGTAVGADLVCPASGRPFEVLITGDDVVVRSPEPGLYGFKQIQVSRKKPVPEIIK